MFTKIADGIRILMKPFFQPRTLARLRWLSRQSGLGLQELVHVMLPPGTQAIPVQKPQRNLDSLIRSARSHRN